MMEVENPLMEEFVPPVNDTCIDSDDEEDLVISVGRKKKHNAIIEDSDDDEQLVDESEGRLSENNSIDTPSQSEHEELKRQNADGEGSTGEQSISDNGSESDSIDQENDNEPTSEKSSPVKTMSSQQLLKSDIFDAEMDDSDDEEQNSDADDPKENAGSDKENISKVRTESSDADSDDELEMSATLKKRLKQGAAKKPKSASSGKSERPKREDIKEIHSETQRIIRESSARIPYHKPQKVDLSVFLARTKEKQQQLQTAKLGLAWKQTPNVTVQLLSKTNSNVKQKKCETVFSDKETASERIDVKDKVAAPKAVDTIKRNISKQLEETEVEDFDNLPDLIMEKEVTKVQYEIIRQEELDQPVAGHETKSGADQIVATPSNGVKEGESGYISLTASEEENSGDQLKKQNNDKDLLVSVEGSTKEHDESNFVDKPENSFTELDSTPNNDGLNKQRTFLTPKLANLLVENVTPKLSGSPDTVIDFDDEDVEKDETTPRLPVGLEKLMDRVIKHSAKRISKKSKDVEIMLITKEGVDDRKELKMNKLTYHIDSEEMSPTERPGAKLDYLKQKLQEQMKVKREEARQKRLQAFSLDNEEGYEDNEEEKILDDEEEMSDHTDTEDEDDFDEDEDVDEEEEDIIAEEEDKLAEKENPFVDMEAEDADEEEEDIEDEDGLHLKLDVEDEDLTGQSSQPLAQSSAHKTVLQKSKTIELFDEDANTESPEMSQHSRNPAPEISSRPFQELSGSSTKTLIDDVIAADDDILLLETQSVKSETTSMTRDASILSADSSFEGSLIPAGQRTHQKRQQNDRATPDLFMSSSKSSSVATVNRSISHVSDIVLPIEDSQDLLTHSLSTDTFPLSQPAPMDFHFQIEDTTQSQLLDEDGLFKVKSDMKPARRQLILESTRGNSIQSADDELLGLCSGVFTEDSGASKKLFQADSVPGSQGNMDELLSLCSGRFTGKNSDAREEKSQKMDSTQYVGESDQHNLLMPGTEDSNNSPVKIGVKHHNVIKDDDSNDSFMLASGGEEEEQEEDESLSDDDGDKESNDEAVDEELSDEEHENVDSGDEEMQQARMFKGFTVANKHGKINPEFIEEEAELSGSEYDSDENLDLPPEEDHLQLEEGDMDDVGTEEELRNQVGRVHLKTVIDDDKRQLKLFQEMYLPDGDLHSDGTGRNRRFRWRNIDDEDSQQDLFKSGDEAEDDEEMQEEKEWRIKRFEREKFLEEMKNDEESAESSELIKLAKVIFKPKKDAKATTKEKVHETKFVKPSAESPTLKEDFIKPRLPGHGSFLRRSKGDLARIAKLAKPASSNIGGASHTGNFVFAAVTSDGKDETKKAPQVKRSNSTPTGPRNKRQKVERSNSIPENSIFRFM